MGKTAVDVVPKNGIRFRGVRLTKPDIVDEDSKKFVGKVCWRGVTEYFTFEFDGAGPFLHRRIMFQSEQKWFGDVRSTDDDSSNGDWCRDCCVGVEDPLMCSELKRLFGVDATLRDVLYSRVGAKGVGIIEDKKRSMRGDEAGVRRVKKYWNGFGKNKNGQTVNYLTSEDQTNQTTWYDKLPGDGKSFNISVLDVFQYGIDGLDRCLPCNVPAGKKRHSDEDIASSKKKKAKAEVPDMKMEDLSISEAMAVGDDWVELEEATKGVVRIISEMRLYWYDPK